MAGGAALRSELPGFTLGPLTTYADPPAMRAWVRDARAGDEMVYACGPHLGAHPAAEMARAMAAERIVHLFQKPGPRPHCTDYCVRRRDHESAFGAGGGGVSAFASSPVPLRGRAEKRCGPDNVRAQMARLLQILRVAADRGAPCPSNACLARELSLPPGNRGRRRAQYLVDRLAVEKRIAVSGNGRNAPRVVTVLAAGKAKGKSTAEGKLP